MKMEEDDEDDLYAPDESNLPDQKLPPSTSKGSNAPLQNKADGKDVEDEEEGEELEGDESDSVCFSYPVT